MLNKHHIPLHFKPDNTLRLVHPKDNTPMQKQNSVVYMVQCSEECTYLSIGETKQALQDTPSPTMAFSPLILH